MITKVANDNIVNFIVALESHTSLCKMSVQVHLYDIKINDHEHLP